jgi:hypothetical protein
MPNDTAPITGAKSPGKETHMEAKDCKTPQNVMKVVQSRESKPLTLNS